MRRIPASGIVSTPVSIRGKSNASSAEEIAGEISSPPNTVPSTMEATVNPSIQPFAMTSFSGGNNSVSMPYLAGEYAAAPKPTTAYAASAKYSACAIRDFRYKLVMPKAGVSELYDLDEDVHEKNNILDKHPDIAGKLKEVYDSWWEDIQPYLVNDRLKDVPKTCKPFHELYRKEFGQERFDEAMRLMTWSGGKPYGKKKPRKGRGAGKKNK